MTLGSPSDLSSPPCLHVSRVLDGSSSKAFTCCLCGLQSAQRDGRRACRRSLGFTRLQKFLITSNNSWSTESRKIAPEKDVDGQQDDGVEVADTSPERLLLDAGQLLLQCSLLC